MTNRLKAEIKDWGREIISVIKPVAFVLAIVLGVFVLLGGITLWNAMMMWKEEAKEERARRL